MDVGGSEMVGFVVPYWLAVVLCVPKGERCDVAGAVYYSIDVFEIRIVFEDDTTGWEVFSDDGFPNHPFGRLIAVPSRWGTSRLVKWSFYVGD